MNAALPIFVRNRVAEIKQNENVTYRYVPSEDNPADLASRGIAAIDLHEPSTIQWHGPQWLTQEEKFWPQRSISESILEPVEEIPIHAITASETEIPTPPTEIDATIFLTYTKLVRTTRMCMHFLRRFTRVRKSCIFPEKLTAFEVSAGMWIRHAQRLAYGEELERLKQNKSSTLIK